MFNLSPGPERSRYPTPGSSSLYSSAPPNVTSFPPSQTSRSLPLPSPLPSPLSARSRVKRRAHPWDDDDADDVEMGCSRKQRRCLAVGGEGDGGEMKGATRSGGHPLFSPAAAATHFGLRPKTVLPARASRPAPLTLPRPTAFLRRSTSDPPPASPSSVSSNGDRSLDTLNDSLCRAQSFFVACFAHDDQSSSYAASTLNLQADSFVTSSASDMSANNSPPLVQTPPYDIPAGRGGQDPSEALPDLSISSSETSASSWFEGPTYGSYEDEDEDEESDEDEFVLDFRRRSVDDLSHLLTKANLSRPDLSTRHCGSAHSDPGDLEPIDDLDLEFD